MKSAAQTTAADCVGGNEAAERSLSFRVDQPIGLAALEAQYLAWAVQRFSGGRQELASHLGISARTLFRKLAQ